MHSTIAHTHWPMPSPFPISNWCLPANCSQFIHWPWCSVVCNIPLTSLGQLSWPCSLLLSCTPAPWQSMGNCTVLEWGLALLSNNGNIRVLSTFFSCWIQNTALKQLLGRKWTLFQLKPPLIPYHFYHAWSPTSQYHTTLPVFWYQSFYPFYGLKRACKKDRERFLTRASM